VAGGLVDSGACPRAEQEWPRKRGRESSRETAGAVVRKRMDLFSRVGLHPAAIDDVALVGDGA